MYFKCFFLFRILGQVDKKINELVQEQILQQAIYDEEQAKLQKNSEEDAACNKTSPRVFIYLIIMILEFYFQH